NLLSIDMLLHKTIYRAATRLASLPQSHPLSSAICKAIQKQLRRHQTPLHKIFALFKMSTAGVETILPTRRGPSFYPLFNTHIPNSKQTSLNEALSHFESSPVTVYTDGSGYNGRIGAAAILYLNHHKANTIYYYL